MFIYDPSSYVNARPCTYSSHDVHSREMKTLHQKIRI